MVLIRQIPGAEPHVTVRYETGALTVNGLPADPGAVIEYGESCATVSDDPRVRFAVEALPSAPDEPFEIDQAEIAAAALATERAAMVADKWQIVAILDLEEPALWQRITDWAEGRLAETEPELPPCDPITRSAIRNAITIPRLSQIVDLLAWLLAWDGDRVDQLFRLSMALRG